MLPGVALTPFCCSFLYQTLLCEKCWQADVDLLLS